MDRRTKISAKRKLNVESRDLPFERDWRKSCNDQMCTNSFVWSCRTSAACLAEAPKGKRRYVSIARLIISKTVSQATTSQSNHMTLLER